MMIFRKQFSKILLVALMAMMGAGCGKEARKNRYLSRANRDFVAEQYDKAEVEYLNVLKIAPLEPTAISRLGLIYYGEGKLSQAYEFLKKAAEVEPENMEARTKLGLACLSFRKMKEAREQTLAVLEKQPGNGEALILLADCVTNSTEVQHIMSLLEGFRQRDNESAGYHVALATLYLRQQEIEKAESEVKKAMALDPKSSAAYQSLGTVYLMRKDLKQAEVAFKAAAGLAPWRSVRRLAYAGFKVDSGATEEGKKIAEEITQKAPDYLPAWTFLAKIAFEEGKYEDR